MAKRELSSTLRNLKFMQRVAQKEEKAKKEVEEVIPNGNFPSRSGTRKCVVVVEGDPHPEAMKGRMSFLNFNPSLDKLKSPQNGASATISGRESETGSERGEGSPQQMGSNGELKRKQADVSTEELLHPYKSQKNVDVEGDETSSSSSSSHNNGTWEKQHKREKVKLDWNVLRPSKSSHNNKKKKKQGR